jgi:hypothetical protein
MLFWKIGKRMSKWSSNPEPRYSTFSSKSLLVLDCLFHCGIVYCYYTCFTYQYFVMISWYSNVEWMRAQPSDIDGGKCSGEGASSGSFAVQELYICDAWSVYLSSHKYFSSTCLALVLYSDPKTLIIIDPVTWTIYISSGLSSRSRLSNLSS